MPNRLPKDGFPVTLLRAYAGLDFMQLYCLNYSSLVFPPPTPPYSQMSLPSSLESTKRGSNCEKTNCSIKLLTHKSPLYISLHEAKNKYRENKIFKYIR